MLTDKVQFSLINDTAFVLAWLLWIVVIIKFIN